MLSGDAKTVQGMGVRMAKERTALAPSTMKIKAKAQAEHNIEDTKNSLAADQELFANVVRGLGEITSGAARL